MDPAEPGLDGGESFGVKGASGLSPRWTQSHVDTD